MSPRRFALRQKSSRAGPAGPAGMTYQRTYNSSILSSPTNCFTSAVAICEPVTAGDRAKSVVVSSGRVVCNRWLSREAERCCDEQVIAELGCSPAQYARSLLSVIESKHQLQPIPVFPGMKPVEITTQRMERIMSLKTGLKKQTPLWCWLVVALAIVVLPGSKAQSTVDEAATNDAFVSLAFDIDSVDAVPEIEEVKTLIRLDQSFIPSPDMVLAADTVLAYVADKEVTVADICFEGFQRLERDPDLSPELRQQILQARINERLPAYLCDEVVLYKFQRTVSPARQAEIRNRSESSFAAFWRKTQDDMKLKNVNELVADGNSIEILHDAFIRRQIAKGYSRSMPAELLLRNTAALELYCRQLLFEARLRQKLSLTIQETSLPSALMSLEDKYRVQISRDAIYALDKSVTAQFIDQPLLDVIKAIVEPHGFQVAIGKEEVVLTAKPQDQPVAETPKSAPLQNSDIIMVTRNGSKEAVQAKPTDAVKMHGIAVGGNSELVGTFNYEEPRGKSGEPDDHANSPTIQAARYESIVSSKRRLSPGMAPKESTIIPDLDMPPAIQQSSDPLVKQVWQMRESIRKRLLSTYEYTPWQIMQGLNGLRRDFDLKHEGKVVNGLKWIQTGPLFEDEPWFQKTALGGQAHPYSKPYAFQGHINQFAAILAVCDVPLNTQFGTPDGPITMADMVKHAQMTANETEEVCWTLQLLCKYLPPDAEWINAKGEKWSMERLVKTTMLKATASGAPNGGTFGLFALAVARNEYQRTGKPLSGVWLDADKTIQKHLQIVHAQRNSTGSLSSNYFRGGEEKKDFDKRLASRGALLEFLLMAVSDEQLKEDWVRQAVAATVKDLDDNRNSFLSCSPLFAATNALSIYLDRIAVAAVANVKPAAKEVPVEERLDLCTYPVADLVVYRKSAISNVSRTTQQPEAAGTDPSATLAIPPEKPAIDVLPHPSQGTLDMTTYQVDFAQLTELIKATVQPETWDSPGNATIGIDKQSLSIVIRQTGACTTRLRSWIMRLRDAQDQSVRIECRILELSNDEDSKWVKEQISLHELQGRTRWALLSQQRSEAFQASLTDRKAIVLHAPRVLTISGQSANLQIGSVDSNNEAAPGIRMELTPHLLADNTVIRLQHSFCIGPFSVEMPRPVESLVGSGQTLVWLVGNGDRTEQAETATHYLLLLTPEYVSRGEEVEHVGDPRSDAVSP